MRGSRQITVESFSTPFSVTDKINKYFSKDTKIVNGIININRINLKDMYWIQNTITSEHKYHHIQLCSQVITLLYKWLYSSNKYEWYSLSLYTIQIADNTRKHHTLFKHILKIYKS